MALFWLSDEAWAAIRPHLPTNEPGARRVDNDRPISGNLHVLKSGGPLAQVPGRLRVFYAGVRPPLPDAKLVTDIRALIIDLPTYGYHRVHALLRRQAKAAGCAARTPKRVCRVVKAHGLLEVPSFAGLLERKTAFGAVLARVLGQLFRPEPRFRPCCRSGGRSSAGKPCQAGEVIGQVRHANLHPGPGQPDGADEQPHPVLLAGKDVLNGRAHG